MFSSYRYVHIYMCIHICICTLDFLWIFFVATRTLLRGKPKGLWGCFQLSWCLQHLTYEITINIRTQPCIHIHIQKQIYAHIPSQLHIHIFMHRYSYKRPNNYTYKYPYIYRHVYPSQYTSNSQWLFGYIHALRKVASIWIHLYLQPYAYMYIRTFAHTHTNICIIFGMRACHRKPFLCQA